MTGWRARTKQPWDAGRPRTGGTWSTEDAGRRRFAAAWLPPPGSEPPKSPLRFMGRTRPLGAHPGGAEPRTARRGRPVEWANRPPAAQDPAVCSGGARNGAPRLASLEPPVPRCVATLAAMRRTWAQRREPAAAAPIREAPRRARFGSRRQRRAGRRPAQPRPRRRTEDAPRSPTGCVAAARRRSGAALQRWGPYVTKRPRRPNSPPPAARPPAKR